MTEPNYWYGKSRLIIVLAFKTFAATVGVANGTHLPNGKRNAEFYAPLFELRRKMFTLARGLSTRASASETELARLQSALKECLEGDRNENSLRLALESTREYITNKCGPLEGATGWPDGPGTMESVCGVCGSETTVRWLVDPTAHYLAVSDRDPWCMLCYLRKAGM